MKNFTSLETKEPKASICQSPSTLRPSHPLTNYYLTIGSEVSYFFIYFCIYNLHILKLIII